MDLEKNVPKFDPTELSESSSASSSEPDLALKPKSITDLKPYRDIIHEKTGNGNTHYRNFNFWTAHRKISTVIYIANMATLVALCMKHRGTPALTEAISAASGNLMIAILFRQENFVNLWYKIAVSAPHSLPLSVRRNLAKIFHYGGVHSGSGVSAVAWLMFYVVLATRDYIRAHDTGTRTNLIASWFLVAVYTLVAGSAHPHIRVHYRRYFEVTHRFVGWAAIIVFWTHNGLVAHVSAVKEGTPIGRYLIKQPNFWFMCVPASCSIFSWLRLRRRAVFPEVLSDNAIRLHFKYRAIQPFYGIKVSTRPLLAWHALAAIPDEDNNGKIGGFSVVVSGTSGWAREMTTNPPTKIWVRGGPLHGFLYTSSLFKRIVVVATGAGIGPCLSLLHANATPRRLLWAAMQPEMTYGPKIVNAVLQADPEAVVWDMHLLGRPDLAALTYQLVLESNPEAVFVVASPEVSRAVVYAMETRGIPAYGAVFD